MDVTCSHSLTSSCGQCRWRLGLQIPSGAFHFESQSKRLLSRRTGAANTQWTWGEMYYDNSLCCKQALQVEVRSCGQIYWTRLPACKGHGYCLRLTLGCKGWLSRLSLSLLQRKEMADPNNQTFCVFCDMGKLFIAFTHELSANVSGIVDWMVVYVGCISFCVYTSSRSSVPKLDHEPLELKLLAAGQL